MILMKLHYNKISIIAIVLLYGNFHYFYYYFTLIYITICYITLIKRISIMISVMF